MGCSITDPLGCPGAVAKSVVGSAADSVFKSIAKDFGTAAANACTWLWGQLSSATTIDLTSAGIKTDLLATGAIAVIICMGLFVIQVLASALRQDMSGLGRAARGLPIAFIGAAFAVAATGILLTAVDSLSAGVVQYAVGTNIQGMGQKLVVVTVLTQLSDPAGELLLALVVLLSVVVIWVAMMIRKMLIIISAVFAPIAFSGAASDISKGWVKKWIEFTAALVFSKLILVIIFLIGLSVLDGAGTAGSAGAAAKVTGLACGALTLLLAGLAPWMAIKMVHFAGDSFEHVHAQATAAAHGARQVAEAPQKVRNASQKAQSMFGSSSPASNAATAGGNQATPSPASTTAIDGGLDAAASNDSKPSQPSTSNAGQGPSPTAATAGPSMGGVAGGTAGPSTAVSGTSAAAAAGPVAVGVAAVNIVKGAADKVGEQAEMAGAAAPSGGGPPPRPGTSA